MEMQKIINLWENLNNEDILKDPLGMFILRFLDKEKEIEGFTAEKIEELKTIDFCEKGEIIKVKADIVPLDLSFRNNRKKRLFCLLTPIEDIENIENAFVREIKFDKKAGTIFKRVKRNRILKTVVKNYFCLLEVLGKPNL